MTHTTTRPQWVARLCTVALWGVGSAYLIANDKTADPVVIYSTPVVWAVVISLPILATYARRDGQWIAAALLWVASLAGCAYTLQATIGRQAEVRDVRTSDATEISNTRARIERELAEAISMRDTARAKCAQGRTCYESTKATIAVYEGAVAGHEARLAALKTKAPDAGERRIARLLAIVSGADVRELVELITPCLFGLVLELATFAAAMFGWHPGRRTAAIEPPKPGKRAPVQLPANVVELRPGKHPVIEAIETAGRAVSNRELARLMGCCDGEATKRRREVADRLREVRVGKHVMVALA